MIDTVFEFIKRHHSLILTTHDIADADGLGAELVFAHVARAQGKQVRIINSSPVPQNFRFLDPKNTVESWNAAALPSEAALVILDTADEYNIGELKEFIHSAAEVFVIDHHEPSKFCTLSGCIDPTASSACELAVELALAAGIALPIECAAAAYAGIVYDTGFFAYSKTTARTFKAALTLVEAGVKPHEIYREFKENGSSGALLLQKRVLSSLEILNQGRTAVQILRKHDLEATGAYVEDAESFINVPLQSRTIEVSILLKENKDGLVRCSLRSKGRVNVSKIAQSLGGGGHVTAAGFKSSRSPEETLNVILAKISEELDKND